MSSESLINQIFGGGTSLAGLLLVFLGVLFTSYESYDAVQKATVKSKYKTRGIIVFFGFLASLIAASSALLSNWMFSELMVVTGVCALAVSFVLLIWTAVTALGDIK
jgi:hypothetical protein